MYFFLLMWHILIGAGKKYEIYFVANRWTSLRTFFFLHCRRTPELLECGNRNHYPSAQWKEELDGHTEVAFVFFACNGSVFSVFPKESSEVSQEPDRKGTCIHIDQGMDMCIPSVRKTVTRPVLTDWSKEEDRKNKYYLDMPLTEGYSDGKNEQDGRIILRLGKVANVATVPVSATLHAVRLGQLPRSGYYRCAS